MRITDKGQVTIPQPLREKLGFLPATEIEFVERGGELVLRKTTARTNRPTRAESLVKQLQAARAHWHPEYSTETIMNLTRGDEE